MGYYETFKSISFQVDSTSKSLSICALDTAVFQSIDARLHSLIV